MKRIGNGEHSFWQSLFGLMFIYSLSIYYEKKKDDDFVKDIAFLCNINFKFEYIITYKNPKQKNYIIFKKTFDNLLISKIYLFC